MTANTTNAILNAILSTAIIARRKNSEGKMEQYTTTMLDDNFKHVPKVNDCTDEAKTALSSLNKVYEYMESASVARTDNQRDKAINKAYDYAKEYFKALGLSTGIGNIAMLTAIFAPKKQTTKGVVKGGYTTKTTFAKYALYLTYHFVVKGTWCDPKTTAKKPSESEELWAQMEQNKKALEAEKTRAEIMMNIVMSNPEMLKAYNEAMSKIAG